MPNSTASSGQSADSTAPTITEQITGYPPEYRIFTVFRRGKILFFRCPWCRTDHAHGAHSSCHPGADECPCALHERFASGVPCLCPIGSADGHRGAHCHRPGSPYRPSGYIIVEAPDD